MAKKIKDEDIHGVKNLTWKDHIVDGIIALVLRAFYSGMYFSLLLHIY